MIKFPDIDVAIIAPYPTAERVKEGWMSRINAIDMIIRPRRRLYINFAAHHTREQGEQLISQEDDGWEICLSPFDAVHQEVIDEIVKRVKYVYVHTIHLAEYIVPWLGCNKIIVDFHGIVPEEEIMLGHPELAPKYEQIEQDVLKKALKCVMVTDAMRIHYQQKYPSINSRTIILPIVESLPIYRDKPMPNSEMPVNVLYAGGTQAWQNVESMLKMTVSCQNFARFVFLSHEWQKISSIGIDLLVPDDNEYRFCQKVDLPKEYANADFGLVLRDDTAVNRVACPTKLYEYLALGIIPIVRLVDLGDFKQLGYAYITEQEFANSFFPDSVTRQNMIQQNLQMISRLQKKFANGVKQLTETLDH